MKNLLAIYLCCVSIGLFNEWAFCQCAPNAGSNGAPAATDIPRIISYQGQIRGLDGQLLVDGNHSFVISLYSDESGSNLVWTDKYVLNSTGGVFNALLGSGMIPLPTGGMMSRPLWIGLQLDGQDEARPLTQLVSVPYAMNIGDSAVSTAKLANGAVTADKISATYVSGITVNGINVSKPGATLSLEGGLGVDLNFDEMRHSIIFSASANSGHGAIGVRDVDTNNPWLIGGNDNADTTSWIGHKMPDPENVYKSLFQVKVNGLRVMRYQEYIGIDDASLHSMNVIGGYPENWASVVGGCTIAGGGGKELSSPLSDSGRSISNYAINKVTSSWATIGGGTANLSGHEGDAHDFYQTIAGGFYNKAQGDDAVVGGGEFNSVIGSESAILGGSRNWISGKRAVIVGGGWNVASGDHSFVGGGGDPDSTEIVPTALTGNIAGGRFSIVVGGTNNRARAELSSIVGGSSNVDTVGAGSFIGGGSVNLVNGVYNSAIAGGLHNTIISSEVEPNPEPSAIIGAGSYNFVSGSGGAILGGIRNAIRASSASVRADFAAILGGDSNTVRSTCSAIGGGHANLVDSMSDSSFIGGGSFNSIRSQASFIGGGHNNAVSVNADTSTIAGGSNNTIRGRNAFIGGGRTNCVDSTSDLSIIGGGLSNMVLGNYSVVGGGRNNYARANSASILGGYHNISKGDYSFIGGGDNNFDSSYGNAFIGGGEFNVVLGGFGIVIGGQSDSALGEASFVGGGSTNVSRGMISVVTGGYNNLAFADSSCVVGGSSNMARGISSFVGGGYSNIAMGAYSSIPGGDNLETQSYAQTVIGSYNIHKGSSTLGGLVPNDPIFIVGAGVSATHFNAFEVSNSGHSIVFQTNGSGATTPAIVGARYQDNTCYGWGDIASTGAVISDFGIMSVQLLDLGIYPCHDYSYRITLNLVDASGTPHVLNGDAVVATIVGPVDCGTVITTLPFTGSTFTIKILSNTACGCKGIKNEFMFHVFGRP